MNYPKYAQIEDRIYPINTDFRVAIKCNEVATDESISDYERALAIVYLLFGEKGLKSKDRESLLEKAKYYLTCGKELEPLDEEPDMDYIDSNYSVEVDAKRLWYQIR